MTKIMTPSATEMTDGQIDKAVGLYRAMLQKHRTELGSDPVQQVLGQPDFVGEMVGVLRRRVEVASNLIVRHVKVDRTLTQQAMLDATGRKQYTDRDVVDAMPKGERDEEDVYFFKPDLSERGGYISDDDLEKEFDLRGLKPVGPYSLAAVNIDDPVFADERPNGTHWKNEAGKWCFATFDRWHGKRDVNVGRNGSVWLDRWWFAGVRK